MRWILVLYIYVLFPAAAEAALRVAFVAHEERGTWQPIDPDDVEKTVEHAVLEVLTKPGTLQLVRIRRAERAASDYVIDIDGRAIDESETHSVQLGFEAVRKADLPSFRAAETVTIGKLARAAMLERIDGSARAAAGRLLAVLQPALASALAQRSPSPAAPDVAWEQKPVPWQWQPVRVPTSGAQDAAGLYAKDEAKRQAALRVLSSAALESAAPRHAPERYALERCALTHADPRMRLGCLVGLGPLARRVPATQRVVVEVFRQDADRDVVKEASEQMTFFSGLSRHEAVQAWLERAAKGEVLGPLEQMGDLPNLDLTVARCLVAAGKRPKHQRSKRACLELMKPIPQPRRLAILWRLLGEVDPESALYLEGAGERENSIGTDWQWAIEAVLNDARNFPAGLDEVLWARYQRSLSHVALDILSNEAPPSRRLVQHLAEAVQSAGARMTLRGLVRVAKEAPALAPAVREKLSELAATGNFNKKVSAGELQDALRQVEK